MWVCVFCASKDTFNRVKRQSTKWKKIFSNHTSDKGLIILIHRKVSDDNSNSEWFKSVQRTWVDTCPPKITLMANDHRKNIQIANDQWMQIKTTVRYHLTPIWRQGGGGREGGRNEITRVGEICTIGGNAVWYSLYAKQDSSSSTHKS